MSREAVHVYDQSGDRLARLAMSDYPREGERILIKGNTYEVESTVYDAGDLEEQITVPKLRVTVHKAED